MCAIQFGESAVFPRVSQQVSCNHFLSASKAIPKPGLGVHSEPGGAAWIHFISPWFASMLSVDASCHGKNLLVNKVSSGTTTFFDFSYFSRLSTWRRSSQIASRRIPRMFWLEHLKVLNLRLFVHGHSSLIGCHPGLLSLETGPTNGPTESVRSCQMVTVPSLYTIIFACCIKWALVKWLGCISSENRPQVIFLGVNFRQTGDAKLPALQAVDRLMKESWDRWMKDSDNVSTSVYLDISWHLGFRSYMVFLNFFLTCLTPVGKFLFVYISKRLAQNYSMWLSYSQSFLMLPWCQGNYWRHHRRHGVPVTCMGPYGPFMPSSKRNHPALLGLSLVFSHLSRYWHS